MIGNWSSETQTSLRSGPQLVNSTRTTRILYNTYNYLQLIHYNYFIFIYYLLLFIFILYYLYLLFILFIFIYYYIYYYNLFLKFRIHFNNLLYSAHHAVRKTISKILSYDNFVFNYFPPVQFWAPFISRFSWLGCWFQWGSCLVLLIVGFVRFGLEEKKRKTYLEQLESLW